MDLNVPRRYRELQKIDAQQGYLQDAIQSHRSPIVVVFYPLFGTSTKTGH
jgi:hypothetical protein